MILERRACWMVMVLFHSLLSSLYDWLRDLRGRYRSIDVGACIDTNEGWSRLAFDWPGKGML